MAAALPALLLLLAPAAPPAPAAPAAERIVVAGLRAPVEILRDRYGVNHIYARNEHDLFFAQGYAAARDRLFQLELWRRQATGTVAEILGPRALARDVSARLNRFRGDMRRELSFYHPRGPAIVGAFVAGINAFVAETERRPELLPPEFRWLGTRPGRWTPEVVVSRHNGLFGNARRELAIARAVRVMGAAAVEDLLPLQGGRPSLALDPALENVPLEPAMLDLYDAFRKPIDFQPEDLVPEARARPEDVEPAPAPVEASLDGGREGPAGGSTDGDAAAGGEALGSNNWVLAGTRTLSGATMLANDPHRVLAVPSLRAFVHLVAPGWNVIGGGEPALPGVSIGHNEHGAWGFTIYGTDMEDILVYRLHPADPDRYFYRGRWERMRVLREVIAVKGQASAGVELRYTRHGPVVHRDDKRSFALAIKAAWHEIGTAPYLASLRFDQARSWAEFRAACAFGRAPAENMVWADRAGTIGWQAIGAQPRRPRASGLVPIPGDGRYEWNGYLPVLSMPSTVDPAKGFWATANDFQLPPGFPHRDAIPLLWAEPFRRARIEEVLGSGRLFSIADMRALQHDELSLPARALVPLLLEAAGARAGLARALEPLRRWDFVLRADSVAAGLYVAWERRLLANLRARLVPREAWPVFGRLSLRRALEILASPDGRLGPEPLAARDGLLAQSFEDAVADLRKRLGEDMTRWRYGQDRYKHSRPAHPLARLVKRELRRDVEIGSAPRGGDATTVNNTGGQDNQDSGASFRIVIDTSDWETAAGTNTPGQSGDPRSPHYRDLFPLWAAGRYFPLAFDRARVLALTEAATTLAPPAE